MYLLKLRSLDRSEEKMSEDLILTGGKFEEEGFLLRESTDLLRYIDAI